MFAGHSLAVIATRLLARRQAKILPMRHPALEIGSVKSSGPQRACHVLANFLAMHAIRHDRPTGREIAKPILDCVGSTPRCADNHAFISLKSGRRPPPQK